MVTPLSAPGFRSLLTSDDPSLYQRIYELWDSYSGLPELLDAAPKGSTLERKYTYDPDDGRFYISKTGQVVSEAKIRLGIQKVSREIKLQIRKETQKLIAGTIVLLSWRDKTHDLMNLLYRTIWIVSIGGIIFETEESRNSFYLIAVAQFVLVDKFFGQVASGKQALNGTAMTRAGLYAEYGNGLYQNFILQKKMNLGYSQAKRVLGPNENHCYSSVERLGCIDLAQKGWMSIQSMSPIGSASCYSNCKCHIVYR